MPELPEVETVVRELRSDIEEAVIRKIDIIRPDFVRAGDHVVPALARKKIQSIKRQGKRIYLQIGSNHQCVIHLGMSGRLTLQNVRSQLAPHTHIRIPLVGRAKELRLRDPRRFGGIWFFDREADRESLSEIGPDALTIRTTVLRRLCERPRGIKTLLLDQTRIGGMGNIYCDEALFDARINPKRLASELQQEEVRALAASIRKTLRHALDAGGSSLRDFVRVDGSQGGYQSDHRIYGRTGEPCKRCKTKIERIVIAARSTHICPKCQSLP